MIFSFNQEEQEEGTGNTKSIRSFFNGTRIWRIDSIFADLIALQ
jgi:hypothetical protein